jgi:predicted nucleotidyltransferase
MLYNERTISDNDRRIIQEVAAKYGANRVILFGSNLSPNSEGHDIDIGVAGGGTAQL